MLSLSKTYECLWNLLRKIYIIYIYENAFDFLLNKFNQTLFKEYVVSYILGHPVLTFLLYQNVSFTYKSKDIAFEFLHIDISGFYIPVCIFIFSFNDWRKVTFTIDL